MRLEHGRKMGSCGMTRLYPYENISPMLPLQELPLDTAVGSAGTVLSKCKLYMTLPLSHLPTHGRLAPSGFHNCARQIGTVSRVARLVKG